jgi:hypothetical protein
LLVQFFGGALGFWEPALDFLHSGFLRNSGKGFASVLVIGTDMDSVLLEVVQNLLN